MTSTPGTLHQALHDAATRWGDRDFILEGEHAIGFRGLHEAAARCATGLRALGLGHGDRIGLLSLNRTEWLVLFFACARIGAVAVAMSPRYREGELVAIGQDSELRAVATVGEHEGCDFPALFDRLASQVPTLRQLIVLPGAGGSATGTLPRLAYEDLLRAPAAAQAVAPTAAPDDLAMVIYTSGTTGRPKGAGLTHRSLVASAWAQAAHMRITPEDLLPLASPLNHVGGITCGILTLLAGGGRIDLIAEFKAPLVLERIRLHRPTLLAGVPTMMTLILMKSQDQSADFFASLRLVFCGGSNVDAPLLAQLRERMPNATLMNLYGLSETSGAIVLTPWGASEQDLMGTIGKPIGDAQLQVLSVADGHALPPGEVGELCFRGCGVIPGYVGAAQRNEAFLPGGWLRTGDLGMVDARGVITLKGRAKDMYIQGGFNVYPAEVEAHLARHPGVLMAAGIGVPDPVLGEIGRYYVIRRPGVDVTETELKQWCADALADYKVPRQIVFREELPLTPAGKIQKAVLRAE